MMRLFMILRVALKALSPALARDERQRERAYLLAALDVEVRAGERRQVVVELPEGLARKKGIEVVPGVAEQSVPRDVGAGVRPRLPHRGRDLGMR